MRVYWIVVIIVLGLGISLLMLSQEESSQPRSDTKVTDTFGMKHIVPLDTIKNNGVPRDGIPPLDFPEYIDAKNASFSDEHLVIGVNLNGKTVAYPHFIMMWHEIVNDQFGDSAVAITYCPLCFTSQVFDRIVDGKILEFGNTGNLYNSNLVMYDRQTESQWSQSMSMAITGELAGKELTKLPFDVVRWKDWKEMYPDTQVLSTDTGYSRPYGSNPYRDYFTNKDLASPINFHDNRLHPKEIVVGLEDKNFKAYLLESVENNVAINDKIDSKYVLLLSTAPYMVRTFDRTVDGQILDFTLVDGKIIDKQTQSLWNIEGQAVSGKMTGKQLQRIVHDYGFWFEWSSLHPETEIFIE